MAIVRLTCRGGLPGGEAWANVFHASVPDEATAIAFSESVRQFYQDIRTRLSTGWSLDERHLVTISEFPLLDIRVGANERLVGTQADRNMPNDCAIVVSWMTARPGRSGRGRTYLSGWTQDQSFGAGITPCVLNDTVQTAVAAAVSGLRQRSDNEHGFGIFSRKLQSIAGITAARVDNRWDTQRRRDNRIATVSKAG